MLPGKIIRSPVLSTVEPAAFAQISLNLRIIPIFIIILVVTTTIIIIIIIITTAKTVVVYELEKIEFYENYLAPPPHALWCSFGAVDRHVE